MLRSPMAKGAAVCLLVLLAAGAGEDRSVRAGTALRMDVEQLVARAGLVVEARVVSTRPVLSASGRIDTEIRLSVRRTFWGEDRGDRVVRLPGGEMPSTGRGLVVAGMPRLVPGEDALLVLSEEGAEGLRVPVGLAQGHFRLVHDDAGVRRAVRGGSGLALADPRTGALEMGGAGGSWPYAELAERVERAVAVRLQRQSRPSAGR